MSRYLVTGGAGFVGSHLVLALADRGEEVIVLDDLRQGHRASVPPGVQLVMGDVGDAALLDGLLGDGTWNAVFHFAALSLVGESMAEPYRYFRRNVGDGITLIEACVRHGIDRFILSSTAALFGAPERQPIDEAAVIEPGSPYGESKHMLERVLLWADRVHGMRSASLRYFNAAGCDPEGRAGEDHAPETHLIPLVIDAALGRRSEIVVFGTDYPTPDNTCIRDYVHVSDLADAHIRALEALNRGSVAFNLGTGRGASVREVIAAVERVGGRPVPTRFAERRPGDPAVLVAKSARMRAATGWAPRFESLDDIVRTAWTWRLAHPGGYRDR